MSSEKVAPRRVGTTARRLPTLESLESSDDGPELGVDGVEVGRNRVRQVLRTGYNCRQDGRQNQGILEHVLTGLFTMELHNELGETHTKPPQSHMSTSVTKR